MKRISLLIVKVLLTLLVSLALVCGFSVFTSTGNQMLAGVLNRLVDGLTVNLEQGRLLYNDPFDVIYQSDSLTLNASSLRLDLALLNCEGVCINNLSVERLDVELKHIQESATTTDASLPHTKPLALNLPRITIKQMSADDINIINAQQEINVDEFASSMMAEGNMVMLGHTSLASLSVELGAQPATSDAPLVLEALPDIALPVDVDIQMQGLSIAQMKVQQGGQKHQFMQFASAASIEDKTITVDSLSLSYLIAHGQSQSPQAMALSMRGKLELFAQNNLDLHANIGAFGEKAQVRASGSLSDLYLEVINEGRYPAHAQGQIAMRTAHWPMTLKVEQKGWNINLQNNNLALQSAHIQFNGTSNDYRIDVQALSQLGAYPALASSIVASGSLSDLRIDKAQLLSRDSHAQLTGTVNWQNGLDVSFRSELSNLHAQYLTDKVRTDLSGELSGTFAMDPAQNWQLDILPSRINGHINDVPLSIHADFELDSTLQAQVRQFDVVQGNNTLTVSGDVTEQWQLAGSLTLSKDTPIYQGASAQGASTFTVTGERTSPKASFNGQISQFEGFETTVGEGRFSFEGRYAEKPSYELSIVLDEILAKNQHIRQFTIASEGSVVAQQTTAFIDAAMGSIETAFFSEFEPQTQRLALRLEQLDLVAQQEQVTLSDATSINIDMAQQSLASEQLCLQGKTLDMCIAPAQLSAERGSLNMQLKHFYLQTLTPLLPPTLKLDGITSGHASVMWQQAQPLQIDAQITTQELKGKVQYGEQVLTYPIENASLSVSSNVDKAIANMQLASSVLGSADMNIEMADVLGAQALSGQIRLDKVNLASYLALVPQLKMLQGEVRSDMTLSGTLSSPHVSGELVAKNIAVDGDTIPVSLVDSSLSAQFQGEQIQVQGALINPEGGQLNIQGQGQWLGSQPNLMLKLAGDRFTLVPQQSITFALSPNIDIKIDAQSVHVDGSVVVPYARVKIKELPKGAVQVSDDEIIVDAPIDEAKMPFGYDAKLKVELVDDVYIDSFGLKSHIIGDLDISANNEQPPIAVGELKLVDGKYRAFGQDLLIRTGQIGFSGSLSQPYLNVRAIRNPDNTANGVVAGIELTGSAQQPQLHIFSEPAMDKSQALSYVLNGQPLGDGDSNNDALLTQILLAQGMNRSESIVSSVGEAFGLSDVTLNSSGSGDNTKVEIAGYIAPGIQVKYSVGVFESISEVAVRYQVLQKLYIEATSGLNQTLDVLYRFDID
ncbi:translocation/assembly module TamB domain-containing protein [Pseudoalteromonas sp. SSDWG2]|uniref:autotransporter assembly complex protein TamB n=1 Tax=Pseudoalteromonas sp. SSDWG2 TaxID=3139391 RepID=UPI003BAD353B